MIPGEYNPVDVYLDDMPYHIPVYLVSWLKLGSNNYNKCSDSICIYYIHWNGNVIVTFFVVGCTGFCRFTTFAAAEAPRAKSFP